MANLNSGFGLTANAFANGLEAGNRVRQSWDSAKIADDENKRKQQTHDRNIADTDEFRALSETVAERNKAFVLASQGMEQMGVAMGPPGPDGQMSVPAPTAIPGGAPKASYMTELKASQKHFAEMAPLYAKLYSLVDQKAAAKFQESMSDVTVQNRLAQEAAVGKLFIKDPGSAETRDAIADLYTTHPDGFDIDRATWRPTDKPGQVAFDVFNPKTNERKSKTMDVQQAKGMLMMGLSLPQVVTAVQHDEKSAEDRRYHGVQEENMVRDDKRREKEFTETSRLRGVQIAGLNEDRKIRREERAESAKTKGRDDILRGIDPIVIGDPKLFADLPPEEKQRRIGVRTDTLDMVDMNPEAFTGKGGSVGGRALGLINKIESGGAGVEIGVSKSDPTIVGVRVGGATYRMPRDSYVVKLIMSKQQSAK